MLFKFQAWIKDTLTKIIFRLDRHYFVNKVKNKGRDEVLLVSLPHMRHMPQIFCDGEPINVYEHFLDNGAKEVNVAQYVYWKIKVAFLYMKADW